MVGQIQKGLRETPKWMLLIIGGIILVSIKRIFTDFDIDCEYAIALSYRMVRGDHMIAQMWEPHQTSAFLNAVFIAIYLQVTGTTTGIALYLNVVGLAVKVGVTYVFYRTFRKFCNQYILFLMCSFFLTVNAKNSILLEFSNMMIYFSVLLLCSLFQHLYRQESQETVFLVLSAVCFCLEVLSYPSVIILFPLLLLFLFRYSVRKARDMLLFSGICVFMGSVFLAYLVMESGWSRFWKCVRFIIMGDNTHSIADYSEKLIIYLGDTIAIAALFALCAILAILAAILVYRGKVKKKHCVTIFFVLMLFWNFAQTLSMVCENDELWRVKLLYAAIYLPILFLAYRLKRYCSKEERTAFQIGMGISIMGCVAVLILTNLTVLNTIPYLILGVMVSMMPIGEYMQRNALKNKSMEIYGILILFIAVVIFRNIFVLRPMGQLRKATIFSIQGVVKNGPMIGLFSDYMGACVENSNLNDWKKYVRKGDRVLIVGIPNVYMIGYLYEDIEISVDSTICTPTYNEKLLSYWEMNPWKEPNVVILDCWFGEPRISADEWIMEWIEMNFDSYADGSYIRVYRRE